MKRFFVCLLALLLCVPAAFAEPVRMLACSVGKADAILVEAGGAVCLIDTGYAYSRGRILAGMEALGATRLDAVILTHTDGDHVGGLEWLAESDIEVGAWYASAFYTGKRKKHPAVTAAAVRGQEVCFVKAGDSIPLGDARLAVSAPIEESVTGTENDNSLVLRLETDSGALLLCGDMEFPEEEALLRSGADVSCAVLKVANHADNDTGSDAFVAAARPRVAVISTDTMEKAKTPDPMLVARLQAVGAEVAVTHDCTLGVLVTMDGDIRTEYLNAPEPASGIEVLSVDTDADIIAVRNVSGTAADLTGWYVYTMKRGTVVPFPDGTVLESGATYTIGSAKTAADEETDLRTDAKRLLAKKGDTAVLMDRYGSRVDSRD